MIEAPTWPDGTVKLPPALRSWLDGFMEGGKDDDADEIERDYNVVSVALWSLIYAQGDEDTDRDAAYEIVRIVAERWGEIDVDHALDPTAAGEHYLAVTLPITRDNSREAPDA